MKDLFKSIEGLSRSEKVQICSKADKNIVLGERTLKYWTRCQFSRSKYYLYTVQQKVFFNIVKDLFKWIEGLSRNGKVQISSKAERIIVLGELRLKYLTRCQISRSKHYLYTVLQKVFFNIVKDLFKSIDAYLGVKKSKLILQQKNLSF